MILEMPALVLLAALLAPPQPRAAQDPSPPPPTRESFAASLPRMRELVTAGEWPTLARTFAPFHSLVPRLDATRDDVDDQLRALRDLVGSPPRTPTDDCAKGLIADTLGVDDVAARHYRAHIEHGAPAFADKSTFVGYLAIFAVRRGDLDAARTLVGEQLERVQREHPGDPSRSETAKRWQQAIDELRGAPTDPWQRLAFCRAFWSSAWPPYRLPWSDSRRELQRIHAAAAGDRALQLAARCDDVGLWPSVDGVRNERALPAARACVDEGLLAAAGERRDVKDPWSPILEVGMILHRAKDLPRASTAFSSLISAAWPRPKAGSACPPTGVVHYALVAAAECELELGRFEDALQHLDLAEREFPFQTNCGTCLMSQRAAIAALRDRIKAAARSK